MHAVPYQAVLLTKACFLGFITTDKRSVMPDKNLATQKRGKEWVRCNNIFWMLFLPTINGEIHFMKLCLQTDIWRTSQLG